MNTAEWLEKGASMLRPSAKAGVRSTQERLKGALRHDDEATSPRQLRRLLDQVKGIVDPLLSEVEGGSRAQALMAWYATATAAQRRDLWLLMS